GGDEGRFLDPSFPSGLPLRLGRGEGMRVRCRRSRSLFRRLARGCLCTTPALRHSTTPFHSNSSSFFGPPPFLGTRPASPKKCFGAMHLTLVDFRPDFACGIVSADDH